MRFIQDDLTGPEIRKLLEFHFAEMLANSPKGACHFLDFQGLKAPGVTFWSVWDGKDLTGCCALKEHNAELGEIKSMRTHADHLRRGVGRMMLQQLIATAKDRGYLRLSLETGSGPSFIAATRLYESQGFTECPPFGDYCLDSFSRFYTLELQTLNADASSVSHVKDAASVLK